MPSTAVLHFHFDKEKHILTVVFTSGLVYNYLRVPEKLYLEMKEARSKGVFLNTRIKGHYDFEKVSDH